MNHYSFPSPITIEDFETNGFKIVYDSFEVLQYSKAIEAQDALMILGSERIYEDLKFFHKIVVNATYFQNQRLLEEYFIWFARFLHSREVDVGFGFLLIELFKQFSAKHLFLSHAQEMAELFDWCMTMQKKVSLSALKHVDTIDDDMSMVVLHLLRGDKVRFMESVEKFLSLGGTMACMCDTIIAHAMHIVGDKWLRNEISVAKEHLATSLVYDVFAQIEQQYQVRHETSYPPKAIVATIGDELHFLAVEMIGGLLEAKGFQVFKFTSKLDKDELLKAALETQPELIVLSITMASNAKELQDFVAIVKSARSLQHCSIAVGGQGLMVGDSMLHIKGADLVATNLEKLEVFCGSIIKQ